VLRDDLKFRVGLGDVNPAEMRVKRLHGRHRAMVAFLGLRMLVRLDRRATQGDTHTRPDQPKPFATIHRITLTEL